MLSQLTKTIKMALKSSEEERAILRARSAVQRFPVVEWRQRMEDFHKRSINNSRSIAGANAWRESDCDGGGFRPMADTDDWNPVTQAHPTQPDWDSRSINDSPQIHTPGSPGQWSQEVLTPTGDSSQVRLHDPRTPYSNDGDDYFTQQRGSMVDNREGYNGFLERANKTIAKDQKHAPDPFLEGGLAPSRPFGAHSRVSSVESISSIVEEKSNSLLNKAIASVYHPSLLLFSIKLLLITIFTVHGLGWWRRLGVRPEIANAQLQELRT
jgi:alpha-1,3-glucan synthase